MLIRFLPLLLLTFTLGCLVGASGEDDPPEANGPQSFSSEARASSNTVARPAVIIATLTPTAGAQESRLAVIPSPTVEDATATSTPEPAETPTEEPAGALVAVATDTPVPPTETPTETPSPSPTETETATPTRTATGTPTSTPTASATATPKQGVPATGFRASLLAGHNQARNAGGVGDVTINATLNQIAQERAETMAAGDIKELIRAGGSAPHYNPDGTTAFDIMNARGYPYTDGAENIGFNLGYSASRSLEVIMQQWIDSPPHYVNLMKGHLTYVGFGMATSASGAVYYAAVFSD